MTQGNIAKWVMKEGDVVAPGHVIAEVETDKATMEWEAQEEGFIAKLLVPSGASGIVVGAPVAVLVNEASEVAAFKNYSVAAAAPAKAAAAAPPPPPTPPAPAAAVSRSAAAVAGGSSKTASPFAKKLAAEAGISLDGIVGTGPGGRIVAEDVLAAKSSGTASPAGAPAETAAPAAAAPPSAGSYADIPHTQIKRITAARLLESKQTIPHYYLSIEVTVDALLALRAQINKSQEKSGVKLSLNDFVIKASALALKKVPGVNSQWNADFTRQFSNVDISVAVQTASGLQVPIVKDADLKGLGGISSSVKALVAKAKEGKLQPAEFIGGTFTISNLGMLGVKQFAAIVNPPQAAILAVGSITKKVVQTGDVFAEASVMTVTLSCDHRVIDGAMGAEWLSAFKGMIESPFNMMV
jgi:pyruvate dehydrogenase E2 component (dihydrolipoamide acetyltransferase)